MIPFARILEYGNKAPAAASYIKVQTTENALVLLRDDGKLYARGINNYGQFGLGVPADSTIYGWTEIATEVENVWISTSTIIIRKVDGSLMYSGSMRFLYNNGTVTRWTQIPSSWFNGIISTDISDIQFTFYDALVLLNNGSLYGSGFNTAGEITGGGASYNLRKCTSNGVQTFTKISCGQQFSVALGTDGYWYRSGSNNRGQLGTGNTGNLSTFTMYNNLGLITDITSGYESSMIVNPSNNAIFGCGSQVNNQLNLGATSGTQLVFKNAITLTINGGFKLFVPQLDGAYAMRRYMVFGDGIYSTSSTGLVQVSSDVVLDPNFICSGGTANLVYMVNGLLYGAGKNNVMNGGSSGDYYDARLLDMP